MAHGISTSLHLIRPLFRSVIEVLGSYTASLRRKGYRSESKTSRQCHDISTDEFGTIRKTSRYHSQSRRRSNLKLALQVEDQDAVVITGLDRAPFCCPNELYSMTRQDLIRTAIFLNTKLPKILLIDIGPMQSENYIRSKIETMVGFTPNIRDATFPNVAQDLHSDQEVPSSQGSSHESSADFLSSTNRYRSLGLDSLPEAEGELDYDPVGTELSPSRRSKRRSEIRFKTKAQQSKLTSLVDSPTAKTRPMKILLFDNSYTPSENAPVCDDASGHVGDSLGHSVSAVATGAGLQDINKSTSPFNSGFYLSLPITKPELAIELDHDMDRI